MEHYRCCGINRYSSPRREENSFVSYILPPGGHVIQKGVKIEPPSGKLGVLIPGLGAVSTTFIAGVEAIKKKMDLAEQLMDDIEQFRKTNKLSRLVMVWCGSTEAYLKPEVVHGSIETFEKGLRDNDASISPSMVYAYAALCKRIPFAHGAPNLTVDIPALTQLAQEKGVPICGKDFKTGQTLMKTIIAPGLKSRMLGLNGWFSTNILGNRDGEVLDDPDSFKTKEESKLSVLDQILQPDLYPELYRDFTHKVRIHYYPPRGDNKEGWDNIDIYGWLGYPMQIKINFLCRDSILAAPID